MENMEQNNMEQTNEVLEQENPTTASKKGVNGMLPVILILALILAGGVYAFMKLQSAPEESKAQDATEAVNDTTTLDVPESTSTNPADIEADLNLTDIDSLDSTLQDLNNL